MKKSIFILSLFLIVKISSIAQSGNSLHFDGGDDRVAVADNNTLDLTGSYTLECWFKVDAFSSLAGLISKNQVGGSTGYTLRLSGTSPYTGLNFDGLSTANGILEAGVWYHVAAVNNAGTRKLYLNGLEQTLTGSSYTTTANTDNLTFGVDFLTSPRFFNGNIDEISLFNVARTQAQIQSTLFTWPGGNLIATYRCNQGTAGGNNAGVTQLNDQLSVSNGTLVNFALNGSTSNWVNSLSMTLPYVLAPTNVTLSTFTANWGLQGQSSVDEYWLDVSTDPNFGSFVPGYNHLNVGNVATYNVNVPSTGTYYYRVYGNKIGVGRIISDVMPVIICGLTKIYVNQAVAVSGDGSSWANAYKELRDALPAAISCLSVDSVLVAAGNYKPTSGTDRTLFFGISRKLKIYGGYASNGSGIRDVVANPTYLDGNIGAGGSAADNSYHVIAIAGVPADSVVLDGLNFQNGYNVGIPGFITYNGQQVNNYWGAGAMISGNAASILFRQCNFASNIAEVAGGAVATYAASDNPSFINCTFTSNSCNISGGAIYAKINLLTNCTFTSNNTNEGGAIYLQSGNMVASGCTFTNNSSFQKGGAVVATGTAAFSNCSFTGNTTTFNAGAVFNNGGVLNFTSCTFTSNGNNDNGGAVSNDASGTASFNSCNFTSNTCKKVGGAIHLVTGKVTATNTKFINNSCFVSGNGDVSGGAIKAATGSNLALYKNIFQGNMAKADVGGIYIGGWGGAISTLNCTTDTIMNNVFTGNICYQDGPVGGSGGGAIQIAEGNNYIVNNTFFGNKCVGTSPGGLSISGPAVGNHFVYNNILYGDTSNSVQADYEAYVAVNTGNNVIGVNPVFFNRADPDGADNVWATSDDGLKIKVTSTALDAGDNTKVPAYVTTDITGSARISNSTVDIGAYEGYIITKIHVNQAMAVSGNGGTWATAVKEVREATIMAASLPWVDTILVAAGTYKPTSTTDRNISFDIARGGLKIYGGYASDGSGTRNIVANPTYLDGDIGIAADTSDNTHVITYIHDIPSGADSIVVDGFYTRNSNGNYIGFNYRGGGMYIADVANGNKTSIRNCSFINNYSQWGGGIAVFTAGPIISNCSFANNYANRRGGAIYMDLNTGTVIDNCTFNSNTCSASGADGGGAIYFESATGVTISNCPFTNNSTSQNGGAISSGATSNPGGTVVMTNCSFSGNQAILNGGALFLGNAETTISNCNFSANTTSGSGGALLALLSAPPFRTVTITGSRFENNSAAIAGAIKTRNVSFKSSGNLFKSNSATADGAGAIFFDGTIPTLTDTLINNVFIQNKGIAGTGTGGAVSVTIGNHYIVNNTFYKDTANNGGALGLDGGTSQVYNNVFYKNYSSNGVTAADDIEGTYTGAQNSFSTTDPLFVNEADPDGADNTWATNDDGLKLSAISLSVNTGDNTKVPANITTDFTGAARIQNTTVDKGAYEGGIFTGNKMYVNQSISTSGDGTSWAKAVKEMRDAMPVANSYSQIDSVFVAAGTYKPTAGTDRNAKFEITRNKLKVYGGYASNGSGTRDIVANPTYLDGEIGSPAITNNSHTVMHIHDVPSGIDSVVVEGFTIQNGYTTSGNSAGLYIINVANGARTSIRNCTMASGTSNFGAGALINNSAPSIMNCNFNNNNATNSGGGLFMQTASNTTLSNCSFNGNISGGLGGGLYLQTVTNMTLSNCSFNSNIADVQGGGLYIQDCNTPAINNCSFINNTATNDAGGGVFILNNLITINNTGFTGNRSFNGGGAFYCGGSGEVTGSQFNSNRSTDYGGGAILHVASTAGASLLVNNSTFTNDTALNGGAIRVEGVSANRFTALRNVFNRNVSMTGGGGAISYFGTGTDTLINNLFLLNKDVSGSGAGGAVAIADGTENYLVNNTFFKDTAFNTGAVALTGGTTKIYNNIFYKNHSSNGVSAANDVSGTYTGSNNLFSSTNPLFADENDLDGADNIWKTADDGLKLQAASTAMNTGDNSKIPVNITVDVTGAARIQGVIVDMGAYEGPVSVVPVKIISFTGFVNNASIDLSWKVAEQLGILSYEIQRSGNGTNFVTIGSVVANNAASAAYGYRDMQPLDGNNFYRLKIIEPQGASYTNVLRFDKKNNVAAFIYPQPAINNVLLSVGNKALLNTKAVLTDMNGQVLEQINMTGLSLQINVSHLAAGTYLLHFADKTKLKLLKQ